MVNYGWYGEVKKISKVKDVEYCGICIEDFVRYFVDVYYGCLGWCCVWCILFYRVMWFEGNVMSNVFLWNGYEWDIDLDMSVWRVCIDFCGFGMVVEFFGKIIFCWEIFRDDGRGYW